MLIRMHQSGVVGSAIQAEYQVSLVAKMEEETGFLKAASFQTSWNLVA